jgi:hypothetical protein
LVHMTCSHKERNALGSGPPDMSALAAQTHMTRHTTPRLLC